MPAPDSFHTASHKSIAQPAAMEKRGGRQDPHSSCIKEQEDRFFGQSHNYGTVNVLMAPPQSLSCTTRGSPLQKIHHR